MSNYRCVKKGLPLLLSLAVTAGLFSGCGLRFGFASDPDVPGNEEGKAVIDTSKDDFIYDDSLRGTKITMLNSKAEIQVALEEMGRVFGELSGVSLEVIPCGDDTPYTKVINMYNSGTPPTLAILDLTDIEALSSEKALELTNEEWVKECSEYVMDFDSKVYSFPLCIEGRGIIYNKKAIEDTLGETFDPDSLHSLDDFRALLERLTAAGMETPVSLSMENWSLAGHQLQYLYETYDGTSDGAAQVASMLSDGSISLSDYDRFDQLLDLFDTLKEYNVARLDPLGADYDEMAIDLADGKTAFWFNGNWAWPNLKEAGADAGDEYGFLPYFMGSDENDYTNTKIQASPSKQVMIDKQYATEDQQAAAREFLNWIVYSNVGQQMLVDSCDIIPACRNNPNEPADPLSRDIYNKIHEGLTFNAAAIVPSDHWKVLGDAMQMYLAGRSSREELASSILQYWAEQKN